MGNRAPRVAFLVLVHDHPELLLRIVRRLRAPWTTILIHVNRRVDQSPFAAALEGEPVVFMPQDKRVNVLLGSVSLAVAMLRLMKLALVSTSADRLCLISGVDYPVRSLDNLRRALATDTQLLRIDRELDFRGTRDWDLNVRHPHFDGVALLNAREGPPLLRPLRRVVSRIARQVERRPPGDLPLYQGSTWCSLTRDAAESVLAYVQARPEFMRWCRFARCPEEFIVHSILKSGPFAGQIAQDLTLPGSSVGSAQHLHGIHYIDWSETGWSPKALDLNDLPRIQDSSALFARKVHPERSRDLLDALDAEAAAASAT